MIKGTKIYINCYLTNKEVYCTNCRLWAMPLRKSNMSRFAKSSTMVLSRASRSLYFLLLAGGPWAQSASILFLFMFCNFLKASINFQMVGCCIDNILFIRLW